MMIFSILYILVVQRRNFGNVHLLVLEFSVGMMGIAVWVDMISFGKKNGKWIVSNGKYMT
jgi:hypothetical protein